MTVYLDPFDQVNNINFAKAAQANIGGLALVVRPGGLVTEKLFTQAVSNEGFAVAGKYVFWVNPSTHTVNRWDSVQDQYATWIISSLMETANDCATDGTYLYVSGISSAPNFDHVIVKYGIGGGAPIWQNSYPDYVSGAVGICANTLGFLFQSGDQVAKLYDPDGLFIANCPVSVPPGFGGREWDICATRDRFFYGDSLGGGPNDFFIRGVDITGAATNFIDVTATAPDNDYNTFAITENRLFQFIDTCSFCEPYDGTVKKNPTRSFIIEYDRNVSRDQNGEITSDVFDLASRFVTTLPESQSSNFKKATVDANTFTNF